MTKQQNDILETIYGAMESKGLDNMADILDTLINELNEKISNLEDTVAELNSNIDYLEEKAEDMYHSYRY